QLSQFNLQLSLMALGSQGKNIQNQGDAVDYPPLEHALEISLLGRTKGLVKQDDVGLSGVCHQQGLFDFALAYEMRSVRSRPACHDRPDDLRTRPFGQHGKFFGMRLVIRFAQIDAYYQSLHSPPK